MAIRRVNTVNAVVAVWFMLACSGAFTATLERVGDFALLDSTGEFHQLSRYQHSKALVLMSVATGCIDMATLLADYQAISAKYAGSDISFLLIDSSGAGSADPVLSDAGLPVLNDEAKLVSALLQIGHAGDVRVLNPQRLTLLYKGPPTAALEQALDALVDGAIRETVSVEHSGCPVRYPAREQFAAQPPDYATQIAPLIIAHCAECHRQGGVGPFQLDSYLMLLGWSPMIREVLLNKRMPPMQIDFSVGQSPQARRLSSDELQMLVHWIDNRAPRGDSDTDPLAEYMFAEDTEWLLGEPDHIVTAPAQSIPATGILDYQHVDIELPFTEGRWVRAIQYRPGNQAVLHHLMGVVTAPDEDFWGPERHSESATRRFLETYTPGRPVATEYPHDTAVHIPAGHKLSLQFHYMTYGLPTVDETRIGLYFTDEPPQQELKTLAVSASGFVLPPNIPDYRVQAEHVFDEAVVITGVRARMQYRGKSMRFSVTLPDGNQRDIFSVPAYNYAWQPHYTLAQPIALPAGSTVRVSGVFDNSVSNPANPDPTREVRVESGGSEMFTGYFTYYRIP
jgi:mono/diheme cytochrome c family protein